MAWSIDWAERGWVPDLLLRAGIRRLLRQRLREEYARMSERSRWLERLRGSPLAICTEEANQQHYEVPVSYFDLVLGEHRKYSCALWEAPEDDLSAAEARMLDLTCRRAGIADGMEILELGCGWGSLSLWMASRFPTARILAISNSESQRFSIERQAAIRRLRNLEVRTVDINQFATDRQFDRIVSVEMFEHLRNYEELFARIAGWLRPDGALFAHIFCHRELAYPFETSGDEDWMGRNFFTGGQMPSVDLFSEFQRDLKLQEQWRVNGNHYAKTLLAWLERHDAQKERILSIFEKTYGVGEAERWFHRWRLFYLACAELFAYGGGEEWFVAHYLWRVAGVDGRRG